MLPDLHLLRPLWLLALVPLGWVLWRQAWRTTGHEVWRDVVDPHLLPHLLVGDGERGSRLALWLLGLGGLLGVLALAGPVWRRLPQPVYQLQAHRVILLDLSPTMNATDLPPSRLAQARFKVLDLLRRAGEGQTALLAYGVEPFLVSPLSTDSATIAAQVPNLDSTLLPIQGARRADLALTAAGELLQQVDSPEGEVILVTDGLDHPPAAQEAARQLLAQGYRVSVLGVGSDEGAPVPMAGGGFLKDSHGAILLPTLQRESLETLARVGGGRYVTVRADDQDIETLILPGRRTQRAERQDTRADQWQEEGPWLLLLLLPVAALGFRRGWLSPLLLCLYLTPSPPAQAFEWRDLWWRLDQQGAQQFAAGQAAAAAARFQRPDWQAAAHYQAGNYAKALDILERVGGPEADYNRGNSLARLGRLEEALAAYDRALAVRPQDPDARANRDLVQQLLDQQRQQPPLQDQSGKSSQNKQDQQSQTRPRSTPGAAGQHEQSSPPDADTQQQKGQEGDQKGQSQKDQETGSKTPEQNSHRTAADSSSAQTQQGQQAASRKRDTNQETPPMPPEPAGRQSATGDPGLTDLLGESQGQNPPPAGAPLAPEDQAQREARQSMEYRLNQVPDDPSGLLRQRFLLQHLRRIGELP